MPQRQTKIFNNKGFKLRKKQAVNKAQNRRIKKLEQIVYPSLDWKTKDTKAVQASIQNTPYENYPMFALGKGTADNQRAGDKVSLRHGTLHLSLTRGDTSNIVRVLVVRTPSSTFAGLSDVLEYHNFATDGELVFSSPYQVKATNNEQTYKVMYDRVFQLKNDMSTIAAKIKLKLPKKGVECNFVGDSVISPNNYNISLLMISDSTATPHPTASYAMRWKYIDL
jgi:hypothetical protein